MAFDGKEGEQVSLSEAAGWTANFRQAHPGAVKAHFVGKSNISNIINQTGCVGIRIYNGIDDEGAACMILVGCTSSGADLTSGIIIERNPPCPPYCDGNSSLNG